MDIAELKKLYTGFYIEEPVGNNEFSFGLRKCRKIWVPPLIEGTVKEVQQGREIAFAEVEEGKEITAAGLKQFVHFSVAGKPVFIFDNHNHAFTFWAWGVQQHIITPPVILVHVDQHSDMRKPDREPPLCQSLTQAFDYANFTLNVGNFIQPARQLGWFGEPEIINTEEGFSLEFAEPFVLDIDMDVFAPELDYISNEFKVERLHRWIKQAEMVTIATSPYFVDFERSNGFLQKIFK